MFISEELDILKTATDVMECIKVILGNFAWFLISVFNLDQSNIKRNTF